MALVTAPLTFAGAVVVVSGTAVVPTAPIPDNCQEVIVLNRGVGDGLIGIAAPGAAALIENTNATRIPAAGSLHLNVGTVRSRGVMDEGISTGSGIVYDGVGGTTPTFDVTYVNLLGAA